MTVVVVAVDVGAGNIERLQEDNREFPANANQEPLHLQPARLRSCHPGSTAGAPCLHEGNGEANSTLGARGVSSLPGPYDGRKRQVNLLHCNLCLTLVLCKVYITSQVTQWCFGGKVVSTLKHFTVALNCVTERDCMLTQKLQQSDNGWHAQLLQGYTILKHQ